MSIPGLPRGKQSRVFRALEAILRADPVLSAVVRTWVSFDGGADDAPGFPPSSVEPITAGLCPYVSLALVPRRVARADSASYELAAVVAIVAATAGEYADDQADLQEAILAALSRSKVAFPADDSLAGMSVAEYLNNRSVLDSGGNPLPAQGAAEWYFDDFALDDPAKYDPAMMVGRGALVFKVRVPC